MAGTQIGKWIYVEESPGKTRKYVNPEWKKQQASKETPVADDPKHSVLDRLKEAFTDAGLDEDKEAYEKEGLLRSDDPETRAKISRHRKRLIDKKDEDLVKKGKAQGKRRSKGINWENVPGVDDE